MMKTASRRTSSTSVPHPTSWKAWKLELDMEGTLDPRDALKDAWDEEDSKAAELAEEDFTTSDATAEQ